jgi:hypothetical protein
MRSVTLDFSLMVSPNGISRVLPSDALVNRKETEHVHGASEWVSRHSVGHLEPFRKVGVFMFSDRMTHRVQVPLARGRVIPEIASMREDFPALCQPMTAIAGTSRSTSALQHG